MLQPLLKHECHSNFISYMTLQIPDLVLKPDTCEQSCLCLVSHFATQASILKGPNTGMLWETSNVIFPCLTVDDSPVYTKTWILGIIPHKLVLDYLPQFIYNNQKAFSILLP